MGLGQHGRSLDPGGRGEVRQVLTPVFLLFQCTICLRVPQASSESLFAVGLKTPRSCRLVLWTAVLASSPLSTLKGNSYCSTGLHYHWHPEPFVACHLLCSYPHRLHGKGGNRVSGVCEVTDVSWKAGLMVRAGLYGNVFICSLFSLGLLVTSRIVFSKGI